jgi:PKD repeat protein
MPGDESNYTTGYNPVHVYTHGGNFTVSLWAWNADGVGTIIKTDYITVGQGTVPVANFTATPVFGGAPLVVQFTDASYNNPTNWSWDFGDGDSTNATVQNPVHPYANPGTYTVTLTATNDGGSGSLSRAGYITVINAHTITVINSRSSFGNVYSPTPATLIGNGGTVTVPDGTSQPFLMVPKMPRRVYSYSIDSGAPHYTRTNPGVNVTYTFLNVTGDHTIAVTWV